MKKGVISNRNKFVLGPSGSGKSFFMNHLVRQYYEQNSHIVLIDTGNSYQGLCELIHRKTKGEDGIYYTYTEEKPISFNPFFTDDYKFSVEKKDSIKTLLLALWKGEDEKVTKTESGELGSAVSAYIRRIQQNRSIVPSFDTFYELSLIHIFALRLDNPAGEKHVGVPFVHLQLVVGKHPVQAAAMRDLGYHRTGYLLWNSSTSAEIRLLNSTSSRVCRSNL